MPFSVDCCTRQNIYYSILDKVFPEIARQRRSGIAPLAGALSCPGEKLRISVPALAPENEFQIAS